MRAAINNPKPTPISIQATNTKGEVCKKINPTPIPTIVIPPMAHELLSTFLSVIVKNLWTKNTFCTSDKL